MQILENPSFTDYPYWCKKKEDEAIERDEIDSWGGKVHVSKLLLQ